MLTARGEEDDKVRGLNIGANDFVVKPYSIKELIARIRTNLRARHGLETPELLTYANIKIDTARHSVTLNGVKISLGPIEYKLLCVLILSPAYVFSRQKLLERVWGNNIDIETRTVDVHIGRLRKNLRDASNIEMIRTVRGFGYSLDFKF
jgi:two-component system phosphate regulon response regulator PhoB